MKGILYSFPLVILGLILPAQAQYGGGLGTSEYPYLLNTLEQFKAVGDHDEHWSSHFKMMEDIQYSGTMTQIVTFSGTFDGNGKKIFNYSFDVDVPGDISTTGLFGSLSSHAVIKNLTLVNPTMDLGLTENGGLLSSYVTRDVIITNCHIINARVKTGTHGGDNPGGSVGGLAGTNLGSISHCSVTGTIEGNSAGGLISDNRGMITDCHGSVEVLGNHESGGLAAKNRGTIERCSTTGTVHSIGTYEWFYVGGLVGYNSAVEGYGTAEEGIIFDCHSSSIITLEGKCGGGLVGVSHSGRITKCYATGSVTGTGASYIGGLAGTIVTATHYPYMGIIENCYATGDVSGNNRVGGLVGESGSSIVRNCYATGAVSANDRVGGLMGVNYFYPYNGYGTAILDKCYSTGTVTGGSQSGGLVGGYYPNPQIVTASFWDTQTSGRSSSAGGTGKTTTQMQHASTFTGADWDFTTPIWHNCEGVDYPRLYAHAGDVQKAIIDASEDDILTLPPGTYYENIYFSEKNVVLKSIDPDDPNIVAATVLKGAVTGPILAFGAGVEANCQIQGLTIADGNNPQGNGGGIVCINGSPTISHCVITNNLAYRGGGMFSYNAHPLLENCQFSANRAELAGGGICNYTSGITLNHCIISNNVSQWGGGLSNLDSATATIGNCTFSQNMAHDGGGGILCNWWSHTAVNNSILWHNDSPIGPELYIGHTQAPSIFTIEYSDMEEGQASVYLEDGSTLNWFNNIDVDPLFVDDQSDGLSGHSLPVSPKGDYHLLPGSACIDAGDPSFAWNHEPWPNGARVNMGAYGNTIEAATSHEGLATIGFKIINKIRISRTVYEYELALILQNQNESDMTDVELELVDATGAVIDIMDDTILVDIIQAHQTVQAQDTVQVLIDRTQLIEPGRLTWQLIYYTPEGQQISHMTVMIGDFNLDHTYLVADITFDEKVNMEDLFLLSQEWLQSNSNADIAPLPNGDNIVNLLDFALMCQYWLVGN